MGRPFVRVENHSRTKFRVTRPSPKSPSSLDKGRPLSDQFLLVVFDPSDLILLFSLRPIGRVDGSLRFVYWNHSLSKVYRPTSCSPLPFRRPFGVSKGRFSLF